MGFIDNLKKLFKRAKEMDQDDVKVLEGLMQKHNINADDGETSKDNPQQEDAPTQETPAEEPQGEPTDAPVDAPAQDESNGVTSGNDVPAEEPKVEDNQPNPDAETPNVDVPAVDEATTDPTAESTAQEDVVDNQLDAIQQQNDISAAMSRIEELTKTNEALAARMGALEEVVSKLSIRSDDPSPNEDFGLSGKGKTANGQVETTNKRDEIVKSLGGYAK